VALALLTALGARFFTPVNGSQNVVGASRSVRSGIDAVYNRYTNFLRKTLRKTRRRTYIFVGMTVLFALALVLPILGVLQTTLFPPGDMNIVTVNMELPTGTPLTETNEEVGAVADRLRQKPVVDSQLISVGQTASVGSITTGAGQPNVAGIVVALRADRKRSSREIIADWNSELPQITRADVAISQQSGGPPTGQPIQVNLSGGSLDQLQKAAADVKRSLQKVDGSTNIETGLDTGASQLVATVDRAAADRLGVSPTTVGRLLRAQVSGVTPTSVKTGGDDVDVSVRLNNQTGGEVGTAADMSVDELVGGSLQTPSGWVQLAEVVDINLAGSVPAIPHTDGDREVTVSAETVGDHTAPEIINEFENSLDGDLLPSEVTVSFGGQSQDVQESFTNLFVSMIIGIILIFALLTYQFSSFRQPLYMIATIPLALIGVFFGLALVGEPLSFPAFVGVVALAGIVVNNAIILIDRININRNQGSRLDRAIYDGAASRVQPILLTTITTVGGMTPLLFADPTWAPLAYTIIFGLLFSTVLTLVVVPLLYQRFPSGRTQTS
jgi:HAE1 family hydrophobic/amphiphilic exporter-1